MMQMLEDIQMRDSLRMFNGIVERCFSECVTGFRSKTMGEQEEKCVTTCAQKFLKYSARVGQRFGELTVNQQQQMAAQMSGGQ